MSPLARSVVDPREAADQTEGCFARKDCSDVSAVPQNRRLSAALCDVWNFPNLCDCCRNGASEDTAGNCRRACGAHPAGPPDAPRAHVSEAKAGLDALNGVRQSGGNIGSSSELAAQAVAALSTILMNAPSCSAAGAQSVGNAAGCDADPKGVARQERDKTPPNTHKKPLFEP